ncbi:hypothetical protein [Microvirga aerophila]|uniref:hypothetical protein n=1 Tax=Microvirga aerophila TaxID=670291 RepID=UPI0013B3A61F|nr:hypothetical protein [Microvirga aerophila]
MATPTLLPQSPASIGVKGASTTTVSMTGSTGGMSLKIALGLVLTSLVLPGAMVRSAD